jgi:hypothetical protein
MVQSFQLNGEKRYGAGSTRERHHDSHEQLRRHLDDFVCAYNFGRRLKTLKGLTPYEVICKCWTSQPERFKLDPIHHMTGLNTYALDMHRSALFASGLALMLIVLVMLGRAGPGRDHDAGRDGDLCSGALGEY